MPVIPNDARTTKRWKLLIGLDEYQGHTSAIEYPSNQTATTWRGGDDNTIGDLADGDQVVNITVAQDTDNEESLYRLMFDNEGTEATLIVYPHYDGTFAVTSDIKLLRPPLTMNKGGAIIEHTVACPSTVPTIYVETP